MSAAAKTAFKGLSALIRELHAPRHYRDTLRRLVGGTFSGLSYEDKRDRIEQIIQFASSAAMVLAALPVPFLDVPVHAAMVRAVAKVHGVHGGERRLMLRLVGAVGIGFLLREGIRLLPVVGGLSRVARAYGATWALGQAADLYFERLARADGTWERAGARERFSGTMREKSSEQIARLRAGDALSRVRVLKSDWEAGRIDERAFRSGMEAALSGT